MAVAQPSKYGSQELYAESGRVAGDNANLAAANAPFTLQVAGGSVSGGAPSQEKIIEDATTQECHWDGGPATTLVRVKPTPKVDPSQPMSTPDDCGDAARTVTGAVAEGKSLKTSYKGADGKDKTTTYGDPELMKYEIMVAVSYTHLTLPTICSV